MCRAICLELSPSLAVLDGGVNMYGTLSNITFSQKLQTNFKVDMRTITFSQKIRTHFKRIY